VEKEIGIAEQWIQEKELQLADPEFYLSPDFQKAVKAYEEKKAELAKWMDEWEVLVEGLS
jgi:hypothetical protein